MWSTLDQSIHNMWKRHVFSFFKLSDEKRCHIWNPQNVPTFTMDRLLQAYLHCYTITMTRWLIYLQKPLMRFFINKFAVPTNWFGKDNTVILALSSIRFVEANDTYGMLRCRSSPIDSHWRPSSSYTGVSHGVKENSSTSMVGFKVRKLSIQISRQPRLKSPKICHYGLLSTMRQYVGTANMEEQLTSQTL